LKYFHHSLLKTAIYQLFNSLRVAQFVFPKFPSKSKMTIRIMICKYSWINRYSVWLVFIHKIWYYFKLFVRVSLYFRKCYNIIWKIKQKMSAKNYIPMCYIRYWITKKVRYSTYFYIFDKMCNVLRIQNKIEKMKNWIYYVFKNEILVSPFVLILYTISLRKFKKKLTTRRVLFWKKNNYAYSLKLKVYLFLDWFVQCHFSTITFFLKWNSN